MTRTITERQDRCGLYLLARVIDNGDTIDVAVDQHERADYSDDACAYVHENGLDPATPRAQLDAIAERLAKRLAT